MHLIARQTVSLQGKATIPGSKSQSIRAILLALMARGESTLIHALDSEDTQAAQRVCLALGGTIKTTLDAWSIQSQGLPFVSRATELYTGNSGITTLFTLPLLGLRELDAGPIILDCGDQMRARPIKPLLDALRHLGMTIESVSDQRDQDKLPLSVSGQLIGGRAVVDGLNSQYVSALLLSLPCAAEDSVLTVRHLHERPYVEMTLDFLNKQGIRYTHTRTDDNRADTFTIYGRQRYSCFRQVISGDFSSASCLIAASVLLSGEGEVVLDGLDFNDTQGDKKLVTRLHEMGATVRIERDSLKIQGGRPLTGRRIDADDIPDLVPALAVIATQALGKTEICNVSHARIKETDRIHAMVEGLRSMGARIEAHADGMTIYQSRLYGACVNGYGDHRTVMALAVAGLVAEGTTTVTDGEAIQKTYPQFVATLQAIGGDLHFFRALSKQHTILIGFKHVGKTRIGQNLANLFNKPFIDLDSAVEKRYGEDHGVGLTCRQIMQTEGEAFYRALESGVLTQVIQSEACVIALGGGTLFSEHNRHRVKDHCLLHVSAPRALVFQRIMSDGCPSFFDKNKAPYDSFNELWDERDKIYKQLTRYSIDNSHTIEQAVNQAIMHVSRHEKGERHV